MTKVTLNLMILNTLESIKIFFILYYKVKEVELPYHTEAKKRINTKYNNDGSHGKVKILTSENFVLWCYYDGQND